MKITLKDLRYEAKLGAYPWEKAMNHGIRIDLILEYDATKAMVSDALSDALDYYKVEQTVRAIIQQKHYHLLEHLAATIANKLLDTFPCSSVQVTVKKTPLANAAYVAVTHEVKR